MTSYKFIKMSDAVAFSQPTKVLAFKCHLVIGLAVLFVVADLESPL